MRSIVEHNNRASALKFLTLAARPRARRLFFQCACGLAVLTSAGCGKAISVREQITLSSAAPTDRIIVHNLIGDVYIQADPAATQITADVTKVGRGPTLNEANAALAEVLVALSPKHDDSGTLVASVEHPKSTASRSYEVDWRITAPPNLIVEVRSQLGDIQAAGFEQHADLTTNLGDIVGRDLPGGVRARTQLGEITVESGASVDVQTNLGDIDLHLISGTSDTVTALTELGDIHIRLPSDRQGRLVADTNLGSIKLRLEGITMQALRQQDRHFEAELSAAADPPLTLRTDMGDVSITTYPAAAVTASKKKK